MRKEMKIYRLFIAAAVLCAAACEKTQETVVAPEQNEKGVLYASVEPTTKTTLSVGTTSASVAWSENDYISVFNGIDPSDASIHTQNARYQLKTVEGGVGKFEFSSHHETVAEAPEEVDETVTPVVAMYCYRGIGTNAYDPATKIISHRLPSTQTYVAGSFDPYAYSMVAVSDNNKLQFKGAVGVLELNLTGSETVKSIIVESDKNIVWDGTIDVSTAEKIVEPVLVMHHNESATTSETKLTYSCGDGVKLSETPTPFYIVLPVGVHNLTLTINATHSQMVKNAPNLEIKRAVITPTKALAYASTQDAIDLSGEGLKISNCYVVSAPGNYVFDAKTPGGTEFTGDGYTADWVWATSPRWSNTSQAVIGNLISDIEYIDGKIYFSTNANFVNIYVGNVIVGIFKDGDLKWSWHIWETIDPKDEVVAGYTFMDRNLGAMRKYDPTNSDTDYTNGSRGFYYQWGRKDPIVAPRGASAKKGEYSAAVAFDTANNWATYYIANTDVWANATSWNVISAAPSEWSYSAEEALKYPTSMLLAAMFPSYAVDDVWPSEGEPCPFGYHVMTKEEAQALVDLGTEKWARVYGSARNGGVKINDTLVLPFLAYRKADGQIGFNWASSAADGATSNWTGGKYYTSKVVAAGKATNLDITSSGTPNTSAFQNVTPNLGMSVRCVKD